MDDGDDKLRRNLVVWSALVIAFFFTGGHFSKDASYGPLKFDSPSDLKAWAAIFAVTVYLTLRHRFSAATLAASGNTLGEFRALLERATKIRVVADYTRMVKTGQLDGAYPSAPEIVEGWYRDYKNGTKAAPVQQFSLIIERDGGESFDFDRLAFKVIRATIFRPGEVERHSSGGMLLTTNFPPQTRFALRAVAASKLLTYSHSSTEFFLPFLLAGAAIGISIVRLWALL